MRRWQWGLLIAVAVGVVWFARSGWDKPRPDDDLVNSTENEVVEQDTIANSESVADLPAVVTEADGQRVVIDAAVAPASATEEVAEPLDTELAGTNDQPTLEVANKPVEIERQVPAEPQAHETAPNQIDLLARIELDRDSVKGDWQFDSGQLSSPPDVNQARVQIPIEPPDEYTLRLVVMRGGHAKYTTFGLGLVAGGRQFYVLLDSNEVGSSLGLDLLDGKSWNQNSSTRKMKVFTDGVPAELVCNVRKDGLSVQVDGREVLAWQGDYDRLSLYPPWQVPQKRQLFLGTDCNYVISKLTLEPLAAQAR